MFARTLFSILLLWLCCAPARAQNTAEDQPVPYEELQKMLGDYVAYLTNQRAAAALPTALGAVRIGPAPPNLTLLPLNQLPKLAPQTPVTGVDVQVTYRVRLALQDFYNLNLSPLQASTLNVETYRKPVERGDLNRLSQAISQLKAYETTFLALKTKEDALARQESDVLNSIQRVHQSETAIEQTYAPQLQKLGFGVQNAQAYQQINKEYQMKLDAAEAPLPGFYNNWVSLDQQDEALVGAYAGKVFTFAIPDTYRSGNKVSVLVDGHDVYQRIDELINTVAKNGGHRGYIHISLWHCLVTTPLTAKESFLRAITAASAAGVEVRVTLWAAETSAAWDMFKEENHDNAEAKAALESLGGNVHVELIEHANLSGAYHEKYFIFYDGSEVHAVVGGLNIDNGRATTVNHVGSTGAWSDVHDVALEIAGPAVNDIEDDFAAHWYSDWQQETHIAGPTTQHIASGNDDVEIAVTHPLSSMFRIPDSGAALAESPPKLIEQELVQRINAASKYVYIENYAVFDEPIIRALGGRIAAAKHSGQSFQPIILLHYVPSRGIYNFLHYITYQHLSFMSCDSFDYIDEQDVRHTVDRKTQGVRTWTVDPYAGSFYQDTMVHWDGGSAKLLTIGAFKGDTPLYTVGYLSAAGTVLAKPVWVHSKVSIFDDEYAGVGSANFNERSMKDDGELTAIVHGEPAAELRRKLWTEYFGSNPDPAQFRKLAETNKANEAKLLPGKLVVLPLTGSDFIPPALVPQWISKQSYQDRILGARYY